MTVKPSIEAVYPLSPLQHGMLFHYLAEPEAGLYWNRYVYTLSGRMDLLAFRAAWEQIVASEPALRTAFVWENRESPVQVVFAQVDLPWQELDWSTLTPAVQSDRLEDVLASSRNEYPDLSKPPLLRCVIARLDSERWQFVLAFHHLLVDGWSLHLVLKRVFDAYEARLAGNDAATTPRRQRSFRDFISWLQRRDAGKDELFWRHKLAGLSSATALPIPAPSDPSEFLKPYRTDEVTLPIERATSLVAFAREHRLTLSTLAHASWAALLGRYSGEPEVLFGSTMSGRPPDLDDVEEIVGLCINTVPLRVPVSSDLQVEPWLRSIQAQQIELNEFQYTSLTQVQSWSDVPRGTSLFDSALVFENYPVEPQAISRARALTAEDLRVEGRTNLPLTAVVVLSDTLTLRLVSRADRFPATITREMLKHWQMLLESLPEASRRTIGELPIASTTREIDQAVVESSTGQATVTSLFAAQVARVPGRRAVSCADQTLTYAELDARAEQLAALLRARGAGVNVLIGLYLERSLDLVVALLGILKAGAAYLPIDLDYPVDRLTFMLADAQAPVLITDTAGARRLPPLAAAVLCMDALPPAPPPVATPGQPAGPDDLAYVIYTSGTTGRPKGVEITHRNVVRLFSATDPWFAFGETDVWTLFHSTAFDFSVWELFGALLYGGHLVVVPQLVARTPQLFYELLSRERVTVLNQTPSAFRQLIAAEALTPALPLALRLVIFGGEALPMASLHPWFERHGDQHPQLVNMYGITETTVHVTYRPLTARDVASGSVIGEPIPDLTLHLLDRERRPVPTGVPGELFVGGAGLARGYLRRPDLTAERFLPDPFSPHPGARLYRTGDLARRLPSGDLEYLGRVDDQVKIRGFRIELGEIEAALRQHPAVADATVLAREDNALEGKRLVAYLVPASPGVASWPDIREFLRLQLPEYMVPAQPVWLDQLPLTRNGKVDRSALPAPSDLRADQTVSFSPPATALERQIGAVWQSVLRVSNVGLHDNFFELGGHSLLLVQVYDQVRRLVPDKQWSMVDLFRYPTLFTLARFLSGGRDGGDAAIASALDRGRQQRERLARRGGSQGRPR